MKPVEFHNNKLRILDQSRLPQEEVYLQLDDHHHVAEAINEMRVRGAPAIGVIAAYGAALGAQTIKTTRRGDFLTELNHIIDYLASTRPTAVNLFKALERMRTIAQKNMDIPQIKTALISEAIRIHAEEEESTKTLSRYGAELIRDGFTILTHCNAGALATTGYGTALGVIKAAHEQGKRIGVFATETRPLLQGARLTAWELMQEGIPVTLITDSMAGYFMSEGKINCVIVGADRITANGDTANKIGTYSHAVIARENGIPFYVAAPVTTIDPSLSSGKLIPIEYRSAREITHIKGVPIAPEGVEVKNPAFDVTPHRYISAIITERGIIRAPYETGIKAITGK